MSFMNEAGKLLSVDREKEEINGESCGRGDNNSVNQREIEIIPSSTKNIPIRILNHGFAERE